jgi:hypothetical protein
LPYSELSLFSVLWGWGTNPRDRPKKEERGSSSFFLPFLVLAYALAFITYAGR